MLVCSWEASDRQSIDSVNVLRTIASTDVLVSLLEIGIVDKIQKGLCNQVASFQIADLNKQTHQLTPPTCSGTSCSEEG